MSVRWVDASLLSSVLVNVDDIDVSALTLTLGMAGIKTVSKTDRTMAPPVECTPRNSVTR